MKKLIILGFALFGFVASSQAADIILRQRIPSGKAALYLGHWLELYPNTETIKDPDWIDPKDGSEQPDINVFTNREWIEEHILRDLKRDVRRGFKLRQKREQSDIDTSDITRGP